MISSPNYKGITAEKRGEFYPYGRSLMKPFEFMPETIQPEAEIYYHRPRFATIDDMLELARKLVEGLNTLGERKYPLDVRRGVRNMEREKKSEMLKTPSKTYFFDIKETKDRKPYLVITESRFMGEGEKPERSSIMVFQDNLKDFAGIVSQLAENYGQAKSN